MKQQYQNTFRRKHSKATIHPTTLKGRGFLVAQNPVVNVPSALVAKLVNRAHS